MAAKHTAGPWELRVNGMGGLDSLIYPQGEDHPVAAVTGYYTNAGQMLPNARLIAAAPELLEALQLIADTDPIDAALDPQRAVRVARAAIVKATQ